MPRTLTAAYHMLRDGTFYRDLGPDHFGRRIAVEPFGGGIPTGDGPLQILADDGVVGRLDDCRQAQRRVHVASVLSHDGLYAAAASRGLPTQTISS